MGTHTDPKDRHGRAYPSQFACMVEVLDYLASRNDDWRKGFNPQAAKAFDVPRVLEAISPDGLKLKDDTPPGKESVLTRKKVGAELRVRRGQAYQSLVHLGAMYAIPHPQYSMLAFDRKQPDTVLLHMGKGVYDLVFHLGKGRCHLREVHYLVVEED